MSESERINALKSALRQRILVLDGAMGTAIQARDLGPDDFGGPLYEGCNEYLVITRPDVITDIHRGHWRPGPTYWKPTPSARPPWSWPSTIWPTRPAVSTP